MEREGRLPEWKPLVTYSSLQCLTAYSFSCSTGYLGATEVFPIYLLTVLHGFSVLERKCIISRYWAWQLQLCRALLSLQPQSDRLYLQRDSRQPSTVSIVSMRGHCPHILVLFDPGTPLVVKKIMSRIVVPIVAQDQGKFNIIASR